MTEKKIDWNNPDEVKEYHRKYRKSNKDKINARQRSWYSKMRELAKQAQGGSK